MNHCMDVCDSTYTTKEKQVQTGTEQIQTGTKKVQVGTENHVGTKTKLKLMVPTGKKQVLQMVRSAQAVVLRNKGIST